MPNKYFEDKTFEKISELITGDYENCTFKLCNFTEVDLSDSKFIDCEFIDCNLSMTRTYRTVFRDIVFSRCKMFGLKFETCSTFGLSFTFENCLLNHASFYQTDIKKTTFKDSELIEVDFTECILTDANFYDYDLAGALFQRSTIEKVDFRTSYNYSIDLELNKAKKAKFSSTGISGLLNKYDIEID